MKHVRPWCHGTVSQAATNQAQQFSLNAHAHKRYPTNIFDFCVKLLSPLVQISEIPQPNLVR